MESTGNSCSFQPSIIFLMFTLVVTSVATAMLCTAIMTEHWEYITWDKEKLSQIEKNITNGSSSMNVNKLEWLLEGQVARVVLQSKNSLKKEEMKEAHSGQTNNNHLPALFFAPIHGGIWKFCVSLEDEDQQQQILQRVGFPNILCTNYLKLGIPADANLKMDWQHRMQNLSISCALVCLIILGSSALTGAFGVTKRQISAILVTGVMYFLAAIFAIFSLTLIHFKRSKSKTDCLNVSTTYGYTVEGVIISYMALEKPYSLAKINKYFEGRVFTTGWSLHLGWAGAGMCILVSILWISLSKIMRFNSINMLLTVSQFAQFY